MKVEITGLSELNDALSQLPRATERAVLRRTAKKALEPVRTRMAELAPFDPLDRDEDGKHLNETMKIASARGAPGTVAVAAGPAPAGKRARANAGWQERGTVKMAGTPYARPAADEKGGEVIAAVTDELAAQITAALARAARKAARRR